VIEFHFSAWVTLGGGIWLETDLIEDAKMEDRFISTKELSGIIGESVSWIYHNAIAAELKPIRIPYHDKQGKRRSVMKFSKIIFGNGWKNKRPSTE
jgi:hypothetical protein